MDDKKILSAWVNANEFVIGGDSYSKVLERNGQNHVVDNLQVIDQNQGYILSAESCMKVRKVVRRTIKII